MDGDRERYRDVLVRVCEAAITTTILSKDEQHLDQIMGNSYYPAHMFVRGIAQSGSASGLGPEGRGFESLCPDHHLVVCEAETAGARSSFG
jgi:hypothetical protein